MKININFEVNTIIMAEALNNELNQYWSLLDVEQRQSILGMIKSFVKPKQERSENVYTDEFKQELDRRYQNYLDGGKVYSRSESKARVEKILSTVK